MSPLVLDRIFAVFIFLLALSLFVLSLNYDSPSSLFPRALCFLLLGLSVLQLLSGGATDSSCTSIITYKSAAFITGAVLFWVVMVFLVNIELATLLLTFASLRILGMRSWLWNWNIAAGLMLLVHLLFFKVLDVARPESWWL